MASGLIRHDDMQGSVQAAVGVSALTTEGYRDTGFLMPFFRHDQDDTLYFTFQFSHRKKPGSPIDSVHIHCVPMVAPSSSPQNVYFAYKYSWQKLGDAFPANASWVASNAVMPVVTADAFEHVYFPIVSNIAAPANETYSSILLFTLQRLGTNIMDTYDTNKATPPGTAAANLGLLYVDCHYDTERAGSLLETAD